MIKMMPSFLLLSVSFLALLPAAAHAQIEIITGDKPVIASEAQIQILSEDMQAQELGTPSQANAAVTDGAPDAQASSPATQPSAPGATSPAPESVMTVTDVPPATPSPINPDIAAAPAPINGGPAQQLALPVTLGTPVEREINEQIRFQNPGVDPNGIPSLFFSLWEHDLIVDARNTLNTRPPEDGNAPENNAVAIDSPREVILGGIVYVSPKEWTIWLNNTRVTPTAIPNEVMDLKVYKNHIELEWFDATNNQIFPIRLRTKQRFNLDTRMFLPG